MEGGDEERSLEAEQEKEGERDDALIFLRREKVDGIKCRFATIKLILRSGEKLEIMVHYTVPT